MKEENFIYWLQGCLELGNPNSMTSEQVKMVQKHIKLVDTFSPFMDSIEGFFNKRKDGVNASSMNDLKKTVQEQLNPVTQENVAHKGSSLLRSC